jgi:outer membrane receptor protein involved in Fe transport
MASLNTGIWSSAVVLAVGFAIRASAAESPTVSERTTATTELEEVVITAERRSTDIQSVAASVSVRTGEELAAQGRYTTRQVLEDVPGLAVVDNSSVNVGSSDVQGNNITIRGITPATQVVGGGAPSGISPAPGTAVYVDGVYEGVGSVFDLDRVEVLRGPQGTLYGRSATTGVVAFHTRNPSLEKVSGNAGIEFGDYDLQHYTAAVNVPLSSTLAARVSGDYYDQGKGYFGQGNRAISTRKNTRAKLLWQPNEDFSLLTGFAFESRDAASGGNSTTAAPPTLALRTLSNSLFPGHKISRQYWAEANWDIGAVTVTYQPAYREWRQKDNLLTDANFFGTGSQLRQNFRTPKDNFLTQELRVASQAGSALQWQAGVFQYQNKLDNSNLNFLANPDGSVRVVQTSTSDQKKTESLGAFAEATFAPVESTRMTLGVRYDDTQVSVSEFFFENPFSLCGTPLQFIVPLPLPPGARCTGPGTASVPPPPGTSISGVNLKFHNFNYKARLEYDLASKNMLYGMISTGFRPGDAGIANRALNIVAAEKLTSFEVGSKNRFLDDSLQLNAGLFYYNYHGFRTSYIPNTPSPADFGNFRGSVNLNVPAKNIGGELELLYQLTGHDRVGLNYNYVESRWKNKPAGFALAQIEKKRAITPTSITANYEHIFNLTGGSLLSMRLDGRYESSHLTQNLHADWLAIGYGQYVHVGSRTIGNLTGSWSTDGGRYSVSAYVRNFTNQKYATYNVGGDPNSLRVEWTDPRTYGALFSVRF